jgi:hypothetical protein
MRKRFKDKEFTKEPSNYYLLSDAGLLAENDITLDSVKFLEMAEIVPSIYFGHDIHISQGRKSRKARL